MLKTGIKHVADPQNHNIENIYGFRIANILKYECFLNQNIFMELLGFPIFEIDVKSGPTDLNKARSDFSMFTNLSLA